MGLTGRLSPAFAVIGETLLGVASIGWVTVIGETCADEFPSPSRTTFVRDNSGALAVGNMTSGLRFLTFILSCVLPLPCSLRRVACRERGLVIPRLASGDGKYPEWNKSKSSESSFRESLRESRDIEREGGSSRGRSFEELSVLVK